MKHLHLECPSGAAGDMLVGALIDLGCPLDYLNENIVRLGIDGLSLAATVISKKGIRSTKLSVEIHSDRKLKHWRDVREVLERSALAENIKRRSLSAMKLIAEAEAHIHSSTIDKIHFHELGSLDTIADVVGFFAALEYFTPTTVTCGDIAIGSQTVTIAHGTVPNPAPATLHMLTGLRLDVTPLIGERTTPTGAAILKELSLEFPEFQKPNGSAKLIANGYGAGEKDFTDRVNVLRAQLLEVAHSGDQLFDSDAILRIETTIDDMSPQIYEYLFERLYAVGALEAFVTPVVMKKSRPGANLTVLCDPELRGEISQILFTETTTAGVRIETVQRAKLPRRILSVKTEWGAARVKVFSGPYGSEFRPEYEDCVLLARQSGQPLLRVLEAVAEAGRSAQRVDLPEPHA